MWVPLYFIVSWLVFIFVFKAYKAEYDIFDMSDKLAATLVSLAVSAIAIGFICLSSQILCLVWESS